MPLMKVRNFIRTLDEGEELLVFDLAAGHVDLEGQQEGERALVLLVQTPHGIAEHLKRHVLDDVCDTLLGDRALRRPAHR